MTGFDRYTQLGLKVRQKKKSLALLVLLNDLLKSPSNFTSSMFQQDHSFHRADVHSTHAQGVNNPSDLMETLLQLSRIAKNPLPMNVISKSSDAIGWCVAGGLQQWGLRTIPRTAGRGRSPV